MKAMRKLRTISAGEPFAGTLARHLLAAHAPDPLSLSKTLLLLPNRRACRTMREAFLAENAGKSLLLPRIQPIGELGEEGAFWGEAALAADSIAALPPLISPVRRHFLLTQLVMQFERARAGRTYHIEQAAQLAQQLMSFLDDIAREGLDFANLAQLVPEELATHWQQTLDFLHIISHRWPEVLAREGAMEPVAHRNTVLAAIGAAWQKAPPGHPIIAAGSTGSQPATANLLGIIAGLPEGMIVLPALDKRMPKAHWESLAATHPQYALKQLLTRWKATRDEVEYLGEGHANARMQALEAVLEPPHATADWPNIKLDWHKAFAGIELLTAPTQLEEARMIAVRLRQVLETPAKTAALITPDRGLARIVAAQMQRFGVAIDDSAGRKLLDSPEATLLMLTADMVASEAAPVALLSLLRHPKAAMGRATAQCRLLSRQLEKALLRGIRCQPGMSGLLVALRALPARYPELETMLEQMQTASHPLADIFKRKKAVPLSELLAAHMELAEFAATTHDENGSDVLWRGQAGNQLASWLAELLQHAALLDEVDPISYPSLLRHLLAQQSYWPQYGLHPRLHILSPMEARLQHFDVAIFGGLNEGTWPSLPQADPWMSRPMRERFGLPGLERSIGQSAHDIYQLCGSEQLLFTRSRKAEGAPTVPSRWLVRLETLVGGHAPEMLATMRPDAYYAEALAQLDAPMSLPPINRPAPTPPLAARPNALSATAVDKWLQDPYTTYARYILRLRPLDALDKEPGAADFGNLVHAALEQWLRDNPTTLPANPKESLLACGRAAFATMLNRPAVATLWWPRFEAMADWLLTQEHEHRKAGAQLLAEIQAAWSFEVDGAKFTLNTRIDRLELLSNGAARIIDYKTGSMPSEGDVKSGKANQLPLEALVVLNGQLQPAQTPITQIQTMEYWKLAGSAEACEDVAIDPANIIEAAKARLEAQVRAFQNPQTPYSAQEHKTGNQARYDDYAHLSRRAEWEGA